MNGKHEKNQKIISEVENIIAEIKSSVGDLRADQTQMKRELLNEK